MPASPLPPFRRRVILACREVLADEIVKLRRAKGLLKGFAAAQGRIELVGAKQILVIEDDVVDANDLMLAELEVIQPGPRVVQVHAKSKVRVVVKVCPGADDPVDEAGLDQRDKARHA